MALPEEAWTEAAFARLRRHSRMGGLLTLGGAAVAIAAIIASSLQLHVLEQRKAQLSTDVEKLSTTKASLQAQVAGLQAKTSEQQDLIGSAQLKIAAGETPAAANILASAAAREPIVKRVYFQARSPDQRPIYERCAAVITTLGYRVPKLEMVPEVGPAVTSIRYFHRGEAAEAQQLASDLGDCAGVTFKAFEIPGFEHAARVKPHQFEVWFAPSLRPAGGAAAPTAGPGSEQRTAG